MMKSVQRAARGKRSFELPGGPDDERPLNERIKRFVLAKIDGGAWPEGHRVPSETELANAFGTARMTVHGALHDLAAAGILTRRPGAGTRVAHRRPQSTLLEIRNIHDEIVERGHRHSAKVQRLSAETCDLTTATELELAPGSAVFHSVIVHFENDRPFQIENRFVRPAFAPPGRPPRLLREIPQGEPVLHVRRRTWSGGVVVSSARLIHPGSIYSLVGRFKVSR